jgi:hypothetical protein
MNSFKTSVFVVKEAAFFCLAASIFITLAFVISLYKSEVRFAFINDFSIVFTYFLISTGFSILIVSVFLGIPATVERLREASRVCEKHGVTLQQLAAMKKVDREQLGFTRM